MKRILTPLFAIALAGCATVMTGRDKEYVIANGNNIESYYNIPRSTGPFRPTRFYTANDGTKFRLVPRLNGWIAGNLVFGGPVGIVAGTLVDFSTGAAYDPVVVPVP